MKGNILFLITVFILLGCSKYPDLGSGYKFDYDGEYTLVIVNSRNNIVVSETILDFAFDSTYILVAQRPWDSISDVKSTNYAESINSFENSVFLQYWIINKKESNKYYLDSISKTARYTNVYGPFNKVDYLQKRVELNVPSTLILKQ